MLRKNKMYRIYSYLVPFYVPNDQINLCNRVIHGFEEDFFRIDLDFKNFDNVFFKYI
jgi:hypothetical protein